MSNFNLATCRYLVWGYRNVYHTHSHIHEGFYRALKFLGKTVDWLDQADDFSDENFENTLVITNHDCVTTSYWPWKNKIKSKLPIRPDCFYVVHGLNDHSNIREMFNNNSLSWNVYNDYSHILESKHGLPLTDRLDLDQDTPFYPKQKHLEFRWATDILPHEIEKNKPDCLLSLKNPIINWVGTIWHVNQKEISQFIEACKQDNIEFKHIGAGQKGVISIDENIKLIRESYMAPAISGSHHLTEGYAPCRIFKNISYGQFGITNSSRVNEIFNNRLIYNPNPYDLYFEAKERLQSVSLKELHELMDEVSNKHTYLNKISSIMEAIKIILQ